MRRNKRGSISYPALELYEKPRVELVKWFLVFVLVVLLVVIIFANFFYYKNCGNQACFNDYLATCHRARFISTGSMIFEYKIKGREGKNCIVNVELFQGELNNKDSMKLQGKEMRCAIPRGVVIVPESDINNCHGLLKEGLQDLIISKLHRYVVQNIGEINTGVY